MTPVAVSEQLYSDYIAKISKSAKTHEICFFLPKIIIPQYVKCLKSYKYAISGDMKKYEI